MRVSHRSLAPGISLVLLLAFLVGCSDTSDFDVSTEVKDLRVLAIRLDPPEVELALDESAPAVTVSVTALVANPGGQEVLWQLSACPRSLSTACAARPGEPATAQSPISHLGSGRIEPEPGEGAPEVLITSELVLEQEVIQGLLEEAALEGLGGARPIVDLLAISGDEEERAMKRLQISLPDIVYRVLLHEAGIPICDDRGLPKGCIPYKTRVANTNPAIETVEYQRVEEDGSLSTPEPLPADGPLLVAPGERIWLMPSATEGSAEEYQTLAVDLEDRSVRVEDLTEMLIWSWFATDGDIGRARTEEEWTRGEKNRWTAPASSPGDEGDVWIWLVLRDNRGGVDFRTLYLRVEE